LAFAAGQALGDSPAQPEGLSPYQNPAAAQSAPLGADPQALGLEPLRLEPDTPAPDGLAVNLNQPDPLKEYFGLSLDIRDVGDWVLGSGLAASPSPAFGHLPAPNDGLAFKTLSVDAVDRQIDRLAVSGTGLTLNDRLSARAGLTVERQALRDFGPGPSQGRPRGYAAIESELGATFYPSPNWSLGATLSIRDTQGFGLRSLKGPETTGWFGSRALDRADLRLGTVALGYGNPMGTAFSLRGYAGEIAEGGTQALAPGRQGQRASLQGVGVSVSQSFQDGRLNLVAGGALNRFDLRAAAPLVPPGARSRPNLSAFLAMTYVNPELFGAGIMYRHGGDGYFMTDSAFSPGSGNSYLEAKIWRDFALTPALSLSTRLYGSALLGAPVEVGRATDKPNLLDNYVEGRVTMNYAF
jgi:hypothetical protein